MTNKFSTQKSDTDTHGVIITLTKYKNYGCVIQRWALQTFLKKNGYEFGSFVFTPYFSFKRLFRKFVAWNKFHMKNILRPIVRLLNGKRPLFVIYNRHKYARTKWLKKFATQKITQEPFDNSALDKYNTFIVGSDQVWRNWYPEQPSELLRYFLDYIADPNAKRIAYAASFGKDSIQEAGLAAHSEKISVLLKKFDAISVRESSGVNIIKNNWGLDAIQVLDPTLLLSCDDYSALIDAPICQTNDVKPISYYVLDATPEIKSLIKRIAEKTGLEYGGIFLNECRILPPIEQWLKNFRDCEFVVTDSFHGTVFSIINRKPFVVIANEWRGTSRMSSLLQTLGLEKRLIDNKKIASFNLHDLTDIDYEAVYSKLEIFREFSASWLMTQLKK